MTPEETGYAVGKWIGGFVFVGLICAVGAAINAPSQRTGKKLVENFCSGIAAGIILALIWHGIGYLTGMER